MSILWVNSELHASSYLWIYASFDVPWVVKVSERIILLVNHNSWSLNNFVADSIEFFDADACLELSGANFNKHIRLKATFSVKVRK